MVGGSTPQKMEYRIKGGGEDRNGTAEILVKGMKAVGDGCGTHRGAGICIIGVPIVFL